MNDDKNQDVNIEKIDEIDTDPGDDFVLEENTEVLGPDFKQKVEKLKTRIKELEKKNSELLDGWQRDKADFINAKRQIDEAQKEFVKFAKSDIIAELLTVLDSFESAFKNKESWEKVPSDWRVGVEYIHSQLVGILTSHGLSIINPLGQKYDHNRDEAIEMIKIENEGEDGKILEVTQVGYSLNGKEIRAPKVKVGEK